MFSSNPSYTMTQQAANATSNLLAMRSTQGGQFEFPHYHNNRGGLAGTKSQNTVVSTTPSTGTKSRNLGLPQHLQYKTANAPAFKSKSPETTTGFDMSGTLQPQKQQQKTIYVIPKKQLAGSNKRSDQQINRFDDHHNNIDNQSDENVREDEDIGDIGHEHVGGGGHVHRSHQQVDSKKNLKEIARKLWLAVEVGDKVGSLQILKSQP